MTEQEIDDVVRLVFAAWGDPEQENGPHQETREAIAALASQFLIDIHRMSVAMVTIAQAMSRFKGMPIAMAEERPQGARPVYEGIGGDKSMLPEEPQGHG